MSVENPIRSDRPPHFIIASGRRLVAAFALLVGTLLIAGGAEVFAVGHQPSAPTDGGPIAELRRLAETEEPGAIVEAPLPPITEPENLAPRAEDDARARVTLADALTEMSQSVVSIETKSFPEPSEEVQFEAERYYIEARELYLEGRHFDSIEKLEMARRLDPGSVPVLRLLAQNRQEKTGPASALPIYELILSVDPDDTEALFRLGSAELERSEDARAAVFLSRLLGYRPGSNGFERQEPDETDRHPTVEIVAATLLGTAMFEAGYDQAGIEAWEMIGDTSFNAIPSPIVDNEWRRLRRAQGALHRDLTDAYLRLGRVVEAWHACEDALASPMPNPVSLLPRRVYLARRTSQPYRALFAAFEAMQQPIDAMDALAIVEYVCDLPESGLLARALKKISDERPDQPRFVQAAAILENEDTARQSIASYLVDHAEEATVINAVLPWVLEYFGTPASVDVVIQVAENSDASVRELARHLIEYSGRPDDLLNASESARRHDPRSLERGLLHLHLLIDAARLDDASELANQLVDEHPESIPALLTLAELNLELGLRNEARSQLDQLNEEAPETPAHYYEAAALLGRLGAENEAVRLIEKLEASVQDNPGFDWTTHRIHKAEVLLGLLRPRLARAILEQAVEEAPKDERAYAVLIEILGPGGLLEDIEALEDIALKLREHLPHSRTMRRLDAEIQLQYGRYGRAIETYLDLLRTDMTDRASLRGLLNAWAASEQYAAAERWLRERLQERPGDAHLRDALLGVLIRSRRPEEALKTLDEQLLLRPLDFEAARTREELLRSLGRASDARQAARDRLALMPESVARSLALADIEIDEGDLEQAQRYVHEAVRLAGDQLGDHLTSILRRMDGMRAAGATNDFDTWAIELIEPVMKDRETLSIGALSRYVDALTSLGRPIEDIIRVLQRIRANQPDDLLPVFVTAREQIERKGDDENLARLLDVWLEEERPLTVDDFEFITQRIQLAAANGNAERIIQLARRLEESGVLTQIVSEPEVPQALADFLYLRSNELAQGGYDDASEAVLAEVLRVAPNHAMANNNLAYALVERGERLDEAEAMLTIAIHEQPGDAAVLDSFGWLRYMQGQLEDRGEEITELGAISLLRDASLDQDGRNDPVILDHLADALWRAGRVDEARQYWERVLRAHKIQTMDVEGLDPEMVEYIRSIYDPVADQATAKIEALDAGESPKVASSPGLDH